jgi:translation initiation factor 3 subunit C
MAAFRLGRTEEAHEILLEISSNSKHRILLAQTVSKLAEKTVEFEQEERRRLIPYHMQLNLQVFESLQFICSMLIEIPRAAQNQKNLGKSNFSKPFKALIDYYDQKALTLAEEFNRDYIVAAARYLNKSEWKRALDTILDIPAIKRLPEYLDGTLQKNLA